jgi:hydroxymethylbilane synthase
MGAIRIGTRESQLALWQALQVQELLNARGHATEIVPIKSEGDIDLQTPLYEIGVQGIFTRTLDASLLAGLIDLAVHSMKDVPTKLATGITQAAVLKRGPVSDLIVLKGDDVVESYDRHDSDDQPRWIVATSSIRRMAQWLNRFPGDSIVSLRGNVNTRLRKLRQENWNAAIFAQAGLERIGLRPVNSIVLDWMLPAPAQGAIVAVCRENDDRVAEICRQFNDDETARCTAIEREFLRTLLGGCSTPISAYARVIDERLLFSGNIVSPDGRQKFEIEKNVALNASDSLGAQAAHEILAQGATVITEAIRHAD